MSWLILIALLTGPVEVNQQMNETTEPAPESAPDQQPAPNIELLLFLAEWEDSDTDQWLDPEIFATEDSMNQQLDTQQAQHHETDPDHH
jgi:hypothetical protein